VRQSLGGWPTSTNREHIHIQESSAPAKVSISIVYIQFDVVVILIKR